MHLVSPDLAATLASHGTAAAALVLGLSGSLHCMLMCGPLACAAAGGPRANSARLAWQLARIGSYTVVGALLGGFGAQFARTFTLPLQSFAPWFLVAALVASALDLGRRIAPLPGLAQILRRATRAGASLSAPSRAAIIGALTPLLPCGLLYSVYAGAFAAASALGGAVVMGAFALGGAPSLALTQLGTGLAGRLRPSPGTTFVLRRLVPLVAAAVLTWRALQRAQGHSCH